MRQRFKTMGLVSHTTPTHSIMSEESKLLAKFNKGIITREETRKLATFITVRKKKSSIQFTEVKIFGVWKPITKLNLDINTLLAENFELR